MRYLRRIDEAVKICSIPLSSRSEVEDKVLWGYMKDEKFILSSAYHLERSKVKDNCGESSNSQSQKYIWDSI